MLFISKIHYLQISADEEGFVAINFSEYFKFKFKLSEEQNPRKVPESF